MSVFKNLYCASPKFEMDVECPSNLRNYSRVV